MIDNKKNLLFLSYGEDPLQNKILQNQFIEFAKGFDTNKYNVNILIFVPISRSRIFKNKQWHKDLLHLEKSLAEKQIFFSCFTLPALANWLYSSFFHFFFLHNIYHYFRLWLFFRGRNIDYVYCRGYHASFAANILKKYFLAKMITHFDPRGLFIEEAIYHRRFGQKSRSFWKKIEKFIYERSDLVTFVSAPFENYFQKYKMKKSLVVYTHADIEKFKININNSRPLTFCYLGQLDNVGWHHTRYLLRLFKEIHTAMPAQLLIITQSDPTDIMSQATALGLSSDVTVETAKNSTEVAQLLARCHFALMCYKEAKSPEEEAIGQTMVASKSGEYLASGLPMICNRRLRGIAELIERHQIGITYELGHENQVPAQLNSMLQSPEALAKKCRDVAETYFSLRKNVQMIEKEIENLCAQ